MSIIKQKYFLFLLFFLINKFIFISGEGATQNINNDEETGGENIDSSSSSSLNNNEEQKVDPKTKKYESCGDVQPTNGIIEDCTTNSIDNSRSCCYVTINYEDNEFNFCIQTPKDLDKIEAKIDQLEQEYVGCDSADIDCHSAFINFSFIFLLIVLVF